MVAQGQLADLTNTALDIKLLSERCFTIYDCKTTRTNELPRDPLVIEEIEKKHTISVTCISDADVQMNSIN